MTNEERYSILKSAEGAGVSSTRFDNNPMFWKAAKECKVYDYDGNEYLDCTSSYGVMGIGYANENVNKAICDTLANISHTMCEIYPHQPYVEALDSIRKAIGRPNDQVMLTCSGSDAVDVALKLGFRYTNKPGIIAFEGAFHGQTLNSLNCTGLPVFRDPFIKMLPTNISFVPYPNVYRNRFDSEKELLEYTQYRIEQIITQFADTPDAIGMILVEPMQNASGYIIPPFGFLSCIRKICDNYGILMIVDEIFTGFGRCGHWLLSSTFGVVPDIVCVGKVMTGGVPAAACVAPKSIMEALDYPGMVPLHGSTFTGNAIVCSSICATIQVLKNNNLLEKSRSNGDYFRNELKKIFESFETVGDIRGFGSASMVEFVRDRKSKTRDTRYAVKLADYLFENKVISLLSGLPFGNCVAFCFPFIMEIEQIDYVLDVCKHFVETFS